MSALLFAIATLVVGWVALLPARRALGPWAYVSFAFPLGLLAWPAAASICSLAHLPVAWPWIAIGTGAYTAAVAVVLWRLTPMRAEGPGVPWWAYVAQLTVVVAVVVAVSRLAVFFVTDDSWFGYGALGVLLNDVGIVPVQLANSRNMLLPAMHAVHRAFGGDFLVPAYAVASLHLLSVVTYAAWCWSFAGLARWARALATALVALALVVGDLYVFHSLYVHSHLLTATYLTVCALALARAREEGGATGLSWLVVAGLAASGVALARPDGPTYVFVLVVLALALAFEAGVTVSGLAAFFVPLLVSSALSFAAMFASLGMWQGDRLTGAATLAQLGAVAALPLLALALSRSARAAEWLGRRSAVMGLALAVSSLAVLAAAAARRADFAAALRNMGANLLVTGGWGLFWYFALGILALWLGFGRLRRDSALTREAVFVALQFLLIAIVIHGLSHAGRLGPADSFNRIAFHIVPFVWIVTASFMGAALRRTGTSGILTPAGDGRAAGLGGSA